VIVRSLGPGGVDAGGVDVGPAGRIDDAMVTRIGVLPQECVRFLRRLGEAADRGWTLSPWDLALAATVASVEPEALRPVVDLAGQCGADVAMVRGFLEDCAALP
jgi:hypothetical protein